MQLLQINIEGGVLSIYTDEGVFRIGQGYARGCFRNDMRPKKNPTFTAFTPSGSRTDTGPIPYGLIGNLRCLIQNNQDALKIFDSARLT